MNNANNNSKNLESNVHLPRKKIQPKIVNLPNFSLRNSHINLLSKGPKFCPTAKGNNLNLKSDLREFTRKLKCREKVWGIKFEAY